MSVLSNWDTLVSLQEINSILFSICQQRVNRGKLLWSSVISHLEILQLGRRIIAIRTYSINIKWTIGTKELQTTECYSSAIDCTLNPWVWVIRENTTQINIVTNESNLCTSFYSGIARTLNSGCCAIPCFNSSALRKLNELRSNPVRIIGKYRTIIAITTESIIISIEQSSNSSSSCIKVETCFSEWNRISINRQNIWISCFCLYKAICGILCETSTHSISCTCQIINNLSCRNSNSITRLGTLNICTGSYLREEILKINCSIFGFGNFNITSLLCIVKRTSTSVPASTSTLINLSFTLWDSSNYAILINNLTSSAMKHILMIIC